MTSVNTSYTHKTHAKSKNDVNVLNVFVFILVSILSGYLVNNTIMDYLSTSIGSGAGAWAVGVEGRSPFAAAGLFGIDSAWPSPSRAGVLTVPEPGTGGLPENRSGTPRAAPSAGPTKQPSIELQMHPSDKRRRIWP
jgi:hypothetical protein